MMQLMGTCPHCRGPMVTELYERYATTGHEFTMTVSPYPGPVVCLDCRAEANPPYGPTLTAAPPPRKR